MGDITHCLADNLKRIRKSKNLTQEALAEKADISTQAIRYIETQRRWPSLETIRALAKVLKVSETEFFVDRKSKVSLEQAWAIVSESFTKKVLRKTP